MNRVFKVLWIYLFIFVQFSMNHSVLAQSSSGTPADTSNATPTPTPVDLYSRDHRYCAMKENECGVCVNTKAGEERNTCYQSLEDNYMKQSVTFNEDRSNGEIFVYYASMAYNLITMTSVLFCPVTTTAPGAFLAFVAGTTWFVGEVLTNKSLKAQLAKVKSDLATFKKIGNLRSEKDVKKKWAQTPIAEATATAMAALTPQSSTTSAVGGDSDSELSKSTAHDEFLTQIDFYKILSNNLNDIRSILVKKQDILHAVMGLYYTAFALSIVDLPTSLITCTAPSLLATASLVIATVHFCALAKVTPAYTEGDAQQLQVQASQAAATPDATATATMDGTPTPEASGTLDALFSTPSSTPDSTPSDGGSSPGPTPTTAGTYHEANYDYISKVFVDIFKFLGIDSDYSLCALSGTMTGLYGAYTAGVTVPLGRATVYLSIAIIMTVAADTHLQNRISLINDRKKYVDDLINIMLSKSKTSNAINLGSTGSGGSGGGWGSGGDTGGGGVGGNSNPMCTCNGRPDPRCIMPPSTCAERTGPGVVATSSPGDANSYSGVGFAGNYGTGVNSVVASGMDQYSKVASGATNQNSLNETTARTMVNAFQMQKAGEMSLKKTDPVAYNDFQAKTKGDGSELFKDVKAAYGKATQNMDEKQLFNGLSLQGLSVPGVIEDNSKKVAAARMSRNSIDSGAPNAGAAGAASKGFNFGSFGSSSSGKGGTSISIDHQALDAKSDITKIKSGVETHSISDRKDTSLWKMIGSRYHKIFINYKSKK